MHLLKELIINILSKEQCKIDFNISNDDLIKAIDSVCFCALKRIKEIVNDKSLSDFQAVEKIICLFEELNIDFGARHDN